MNIGSASLTWGCGKCPFLNDSCQFKDRNSRNPNVVSHRFPGAANSLSANTCTENTSLAICILSRRFMNFQLPVTGKAKCKVHLLSLLRVGPHWQKTQVRSISPESAKAPNTAPIKHRETTRGCWMSSANLAGGNVEHSVASSNPCGEHKVYPHCVELEGSRISAS